MKYQIINLVKIIDLNPKDFLYVTYGWMKGQINSFLN